jgi:fatty-acid peroxygenase
MRREIGLRLVRHGYEALDRLRLESGGADCFEARMLGRRALVVRGGGGVRKFYDPGLVTRKGAIPAPVRLLLFGRGAVHGLNGQEHHDRKQMFLRAVDPSLVARMSDDVARRLKARVVDWEARTSVPLFDELVEAYGMAVISGVGIEIPEEQARTVSHELARIVDAFGTGGTSYLRGCVARTRANRWASHLIREVRDGSRTAEGSVLAAVAGRKDLSDTVAAVELLNILRPTVAVAYFGAFAAQALGRHPEWKDRMAAGEPSDLRAFGHEVRRCYPFVPLLTGRLVRDFAWARGRLPRGSFMVLDVIGTDLDPRRWQQPTTFDPERFVDREPNPFEYVPQGGGDPAQGHRCPGEPLTVGILEVTVRELARLDFQVTPPSRTVPLRRIPSLPPEGMELRHVRRTPRPQPAENLAGY